MADEITVAGSAARTRERLEGLKTVTMAVYVLQALSFLWGVTAIVAIVVCYLKRDDMRGTLYESHSEWQIRTFWWGLVWSAVGMLTVLLLGLGFLVLFVAYVWTIYRVVKGFLRLTEGKPVMPA